MVSVMTSSEDASSNQYPEFYVILLKVQVLWLKEEQSFDNICPNEKLRHSNAIKERRNLFMLYFLTINLSEI